MNDFTLPKVARLTSKKAIDALFLASRRHGASQSLLAYPLRACCVEAFPRRDGFEGAKMLVSVPKKKIRRAHDRVTVRRRVREAWRLARAKDCFALKDVALIYVADKPVDYSRIRTAVDRIISRLGSCNPEAASQDCTAQEGA